MSREIRIPSTRILGTGHYVPEKVVTNAEIEARGATTDGWIRQHTGVERRHVAAPGEVTSDMATAAGRAAIEAAGLTVADLDMIILATTSGDTPMPATAVHVQQKLGADLIPSFDIGASFAGFLYALTVADQFIAAGTCKTILVIGADLLSRTVDPEDRTTAALFGDGAGAVVLTATGAGADIGPVALHSDPDGRHLIRLGRDDARIRMDGPLVFRHAVRLLVDVSQEAAASAGVALEDVDLFVFHQANSRIIGAVARELGLETDRVVDVVARFANTSAASIPIALSVASAEGRLAPGATVLLAAFGAGLVWGGAVVTWRPDEAAAARPARYS